MDNLEELVIQIPAGRGMRASEGAARTLKLPHISIRIGNGVCYVLGGFMMHLLHQDLPAFNVLCRGHLESQKGSGLVSSQARPADMGHDSTFRILDVCSGSEELKRNFWA